MNGEEMCQRLPSNPAVISILIKLMETEYTSDAFRVPIKSGEAVKARQGEAQYV